MSEQFWLDVIARISATEPVDLDASVLWAGAKTEDAPTFRQARQNTNITPSAWLWDTKEPEQSYIGIRVDERPADCSRPALRLAVAALERGVVPIIITTLAYSGFERFGFRVERIMGDNAVERQRLRDEIRQFWNIALVIDITDVTSIG